MHIAQVLPVMTPTPPLKYGGIQRVTYEIIMRQAERGHKVTVFAAGGSTVEDKNIQLIEGSPYPTAGMNGVNRRYEIEQLIDVVARQSDFDVINMHYEPIILRLQTEGADINLLNHIHTPTLTTFHNSTDIPSHLEYYKNHTELWSREYAFLSKSHYQPLNFFPNAAILYNGLPIEEFPFSEKPGSYLLFLGRITKNKGILAAIEVAKRTDIPLKIIARIDTPDEAFYESEVKHLIDGERIQYLGEADFNEKVNYFKNALCTLFPISWAEPFGSVMTESMACGTPVVAFNKGSVPEIVKNGVSGTIVETIEEMVQAVKNISSIDRKKCREYVEQNFTIDRLVDQYDELFNRIIKK